MTTKAEIEKIIQNEVSIEKSTDENLIDVPVIFRVPISFFNNDQQDIKSFALALGYKKKVFFKKEDEAEVKLIDNPQSELSFLVDKVRDNFKNIFINTISEIESSQFKKVTRESLNKKFNAKN